MTKEIVALDFETSGLDLKNDKIVQIGMVKFDSTTFETLGTLNLYINPTGKWEMNPSATEKTGLTKEFIEENGVNLKDSWSTIESFIGDCDILTYNGNNFDIPMLYNNLKSEGIDFDFKGRTYYDSFTIESKRYSRKLTDTYKRYTGKDLENAHDALADVMATIEVFSAQVKNGTDDIKELENDAFTMVSPENFVKFNDKKELVFTIGKYQGIPTNTVCLTDPSYIKWICENFSDITKQSILNEYLKTKKN